MAYMGYSNFICSLPQILYDSIKDTNDDHWIWLLEISLFVRFVNMPKITETQLEEMDSSLGPFIINGLFGQKTKIKGQILMGFSMIKRHCLQIDIEKKEF